MDAITVQLTVEALGAPIQAATPAKPNLLAIDPATRAELAADDAATAALPDSAVPAAHDRGHLYSPGANTVAAGITYRPGTQHQPLPPCPSSGGPAFRAWLDTVKQPATDYLGLRTGDRITVQDPSGTGEVIATHRFGAVVRYPMPDGAAEPYAEMYVRSRNHNGHWY